MSPELCFESQERSLFVLFVKDICMSKGQQVSKSELEKQLGQLRGDCFGWAVAPVT